MSNLVKRTITGTAFIIVMVAGLVVSKWLFAILALFVMVCSIREFYNMSLGSLFKLERLTAIVSAILAFVLVFLIASGAMEWKWIGLVLLPLMEIPVLALKAMGSKDFDRFAYVYVPLVYVALPISLCPLLVLGPSGFSGYLLLSMFIMIWCSDVGAYCVGTLLGQRPGSRKLAPHISPKKSWWGVGGGVFFCILAALVLHFVGWLSFDIAHCCAVGAVISVGGVIGDLFESVWKRHFGFKDSGNIIPGHGGMLDRFDSSLVAIPLAAVYLSIFNLL